MRTLLSNILLLISIFCYSQAGAQTAIADSGKYEFKQQAKQQVSDYTKAYRILTNQVTLNPENAELRYFLGYAIDRLNADDGKQMFQVKKEMTIKASEQFEAVNKLEPIYKGEKFLLDPYSKITSIWGSLAEAYLNRNIEDSAIWAFEEGKRRGGFIEPILEYNRQLLNSCSKNSILITSGDNITIPIWYLQTIEKLRTDITIIDANLINTVWYPKYLKNRKHLKLSYTDTQIDTINYCEWKPKQIVINNLKNPSQIISWELKPTYMENYILKGDRILLDVFEQNYFEKDIYFNSNSDSTYNLFLDNYLVDEGLVNRVSSKKINYESDSVVISNNLERYNIESLKADDIKKSSDAISLLNGFRLTYYLNIYRLLEKGNYEKAKELLSELKQKFDIEKLPFMSEEQKKYSDQLFTQLG